MTKAPYQQKIQQPIDNTKTPPNTSITQRLLTDLGRSFGVTTAIQLVWLNRFTGTKPSHLLHYRDWGPTANQRREVIKLWYTDIYSNVIVYQKYLVTSVKVGNATRSLHAS